MADHRATKKSQLSKPSAPLKIQRRGNDRKERRRSIEYRRYFDPRWISVIRLSRVFLEWNAALALFSRRWRGEERGKGRKRENENGLVWFEARIAVYVGIEKGSCRNEVVKRFFTRDTRRRHVPCHIRSNLNGARSTDDERRKPRKRNSRVASNASNIFRASRANVFVCVLISAGGRKLFADAMFKAYITFVSSFRADGYYL